VAVARLVWLQCDGCDENTYDESYRHNCLTRDAAIKLGRKYGWTLRGKKILCVECKEG